jgi:hypothetical protein
MDSLSQSAHSTRIPDGSGWKKHWLKDHEKNYNASQRLEYMSTNLIMLKALDKISKSTHSGDDISTERLEHLFRRVWFIEQQQRRIQADSQTVKNDTNDHTDQYLSMEREIRDSDRSPDQLSFLDSNNNGMASGVMSLIDVDKYADQGTDAGQRDAVYESNISTSSAAGVPTSRPGCAPLEGSGGGYMQHNDGDSTEPHGVVAEEGSSLSSRQHLYRYKGAYQARAVDDSSHDTLLDASIHHR